MFRPLLLAISWLLVNNLVICAEDWSGFRGPQGNGIALGDGYPVEWSQETNVDWRVELPAPGNGSPIVVGDRVLVLCAENQGRQRSTLCFDRQDGSMLWKRTVEFPHVEETHKTNPYCPSTPVSDGEHVFVWHRSAGMHCYRLDGTPVWSRDLGEFHHIWGGGSSPILYQDLVIQLCGPGERTFLIALDQQTGETRWQSEIEPGGSASDQGRYVGTWATPVLVDVAGSPRLICPYHQRVVSYDPATGKELAFRFGLEREKSDLCYTSPMIGDGMAVVMGGFRGPAFAFRLGGVGDTTASHRLWRVEQGNPQRIGSGVILDGHLFMANADNSGSIECLHVETGQQRWQVRRSQDGPHWGSVVYAAGHLYATGQRGTTTVFKPNPQAFEQVAVNVLGEQSNATPAFSNGQIFLRTDRALYRISQQSPAP